MLQSWRNALAYAGPEIGGSHVSIGRTAQLVRAPSHERGGGRPCGGVRVVRRKSAGGKTRGISECCHCSSHVQGHGDAGGALPAASRNTMRPCSAARLTTPPTSPEATAWFSTARAAVAVGNSGLAVPHPVAIPNRMVQ